MEPRRPEPSRLLAQSEFYDTWRFLPDAFAHPCPCVARSLTITPKGQFDVGWLGPMPFLARTTFPAITRNVG